MTEALFQKLEEKMMIVLSEIEDLRKETQQLRHENSILKAEKQNREVEKLNQEKKLETMISLLDSVCEAEKLVAGHASANITNIGVTHATEVA